MRYNRKLKQSRSQFKIKKNKLLCLMLTILISLSLGACSSESSYSADIDKGTISNPYALGDIVEIEAHDQVGIAYSAIGRQVENPITFEISNLEILEQQIYSYKENGTEVTKDNYYLVTFDIEVIETSVTDAITFDSDYLWLMNVNSNGQLGNGSLSFTSAEYPDDYIYFQWQSVIPTEGALWHFANVIYTENEADLAYIVFEYYNSEGETSYVYFAADDLNEQESEELIEEVEESEETDPSEETYQTALAAKEKGYYTFAMNLFSEISDYSDSQEQYDELKDFLSAYNGTYYGQSTKYGAYYYIWIQDGAVTVQMDPELMETDKTEFELYVCDIIDDTGEPVIAFSHPMSIYSFSTGREYGDGYVMQLLSDGSWIVAATEGSKYYTFGGFYDKISDTVELE